MYRKSLLFTARTHDADHPIPSICALKEPFETQAEGAVGVESQPAASATASATAASRRRCMLSPPFSTGSEPNYHPSVGTPTQQERKASTRSTRSFACS